MNFPLSTLGDILSAPLLQEKPLHVTGTSFDSRKTQAGDLFIPIVAANDGHDFLDDAIKHGAVASLWQKDHQPYPTQLPIILVDDTLLAFQQLAQAYLKMFHPKVVAISGSNGKTTTKDLTAAIGATSFNTYKTPANFNNELGVPTTILNMPADTELLVIELGMDHPNDLVALSNLVQPDIAVLTMIGEAHIEFFKTRAKIADGKMQIITGLKPGGSLVYNGDEPLLRERVQQHPALNTRTFGLENTNDNFANAIHLASASAHFCWQPLNETIQIPLTGTYNVSNALAALSVGQLLGISPALMAKALATATITENRTQWLPGNFGGQLLSDVYNANPTAVQEVLKSFGQVPTKGERYVVLGDMLELGAQGPAMHAALASSLKPQTVHEVFLIGPLMQNLAEELTKTYSADHLHYYRQDQQAELIHDLQATLSPDDLLLLKGSHGMHLERVVAALYDHN